MKIVKVLCLSNPPGYPRKGVINLHALWPDLKLGITTEKSITKILSIQPILSFSTVNSFPGYIIPIGYRLRSFFQYYWYQKIFLRLVVFFLIIILESQRIENWISLAIVRPPFHGFTGNIWIGNNDIVTDARYESPK
jgi:hypothetical protein